MCGVLAITIDEFNEGDHDLIRGLFQQSMIRGKHATGVSYVKNEIVNTIKEPIPADEFIKNISLAYHETFNIHLQSYIVNISNGVEELEKELVIN